MFLASLSKGFSSRNLAALISIAGSSCCWPLTQRALNSSSIITPEMIAYLFFMSTVPLSRQWSCRHFLIILNDSAERFVRIMIKQTRPALARRLRKQFLFRLERFDRIELNSHDHGERHVRPHRHQVAKPEKRF